MVFKVVFFFRFIMIIFLIVESVGTIENENCFFGKILFYLTKTICSGNILFRFYEHSVILRQRMFF